VGDVVRRAAGWAAASAAALAAALAALFLLTLALRRKARRVAPPPGETLIVDGVPLHFVDRGSGPPVVYLHGAKGSVYDALLSIADDLTRDHRLLAVDRPGHGYSGRPAEHAGSPFVQAELIRGLLRRLDVERPVLVAHSAGASVALALALEHPDEVAAVVTVAGYVMSLRSPGRAPSRLLTLPVLGPLVCWTVAVPFGSLVAGRLLRRMAGTDSVPAAYDDIGPAMALDPDSLRFSAYDLADVEEGLLALEPRYADLGVPLVIVHGQDDPVIWPSQAAQLKALVPGADLVLVPGAGHLPHFTHPQDVLAAVRLADERAETR
jgi:pimeloyl-ACP methyl ester carboxylesterase